MIITFKRMFSAKEQQREFNARPRNQRNGIERATTGAGAAAKHASEGVDRLNKHSQELSNFNGDVDAWIESYKGTGKYKSLKSRYSNEAQRNELLNTYKGQAAESQASIAKAAKGMDAAQKTIGDQTHNYGKTRQSVRNAEAGGNTFEAGGKTVNVLEGSKGDVAVKQTAGVHNGGAKTEVLTETSERRAADIKRLENQTIPEANMKVGGKKTGREARAIKKNSKPVATELNRNGVAENAANVQMVTPNKTVNAVVTTTPNAAPTVTSTNITRTPKPKPNTNPKPSTKPAIQEPLNSNAGNSLKKYITKRNVILGTGLVAAGGLGYAAYKKKKANNQQNQQ